MRRIVKDKQRFERLEVSKNDLLEMFAYNKFKLRVLEEKVTSEKTTVYRCGSLIDLCRGPHIRHTGRIKALKLLKVSEFQQKPVQNRHKIFLQIFYRKAPFTGMAVPTLKILNDSMASHSLPTNN